MRLPRSHRFAFAAAAFASFFAADGAFACPFCKETADGTSHGLAAGFNASVYVTFATMATLLGFFSLLICRGARAVARIERTELEARASRAKETAEETADGSGEPTFFATGAGAPTPHAPSAAPPARSR